MRGTENTAQALLNSVACWEEDPGLVLSRDFFCLFLCGGQWLQTAVTEQNFTALWSDGVGGHGGELLQMNWGGGMGLCRRDIAEFGIT